MDSSPITAQLIGPAQDVLPGRLGEFVTALLEGRVNNFALVWNTDGKIHDSTFNDPNFGSPFLLLGMVNSLAHDLAESLRPKE